MSSGDSHVTFDVLLGAYGNLCISRLPAGETEYIMFANESLSKRIAQFGSLIEENCQIDFTAVSLTTVFKPVNYVDMKLIMLIYEDEGDSEVKARQAMEKERKRLANERRHRIQILVIDIVSQVKLFDRVKFFFSYDMKDLPLLLLLSRVSRVRLCVTP
ncbi:hypothetical protein MJT46_012535 [Ovis ammon polii x Ovis aries]|nr:hypothetical protein MJT46_012535 [Ovis ammon polii x Ovis aries]